MVFFDMLTRIKVVLTALISGILGSVNYEVGPQQQGLTLD